MKKNVLILKHFLMVKTLVIIVIILLIKMNLYYLTNAKLVRYIHYVVEVALLKKKIIHFVKLEKNYLNLFQR